jgi:protein phosphatase 2C-like protein
MTAAASPTVAWRVHGVSLQGYGHLRDGVECQDAHRQLALDAPGAHVLAVADGAGSRHRSAEGAALAVGLCTDVLARRLRGGLPDSADDWTAVLTAAAEEVISRFQGVTAQIGPDPGAFAATLTAAVLHWPWLAVMSLGDGFVMTRVQGAGEDEDFHLVAYGGGRGEYVNETVFLSSRGALSDCVVLPVYDPDITGVVLSTDGLVPLATRGDADQRRPNVSFLTPLLATFDDAHPDPSEVARFLLQDQVSSLTADDKTLLVAVPR